MSNYKTIVLDVEGTTTSIDFVHKVLFPYAREKMADYVADYSHDPLVQKAIEGVQDTALKEEGVDLDLQGAIAKLIQWIDEDRKQQDLKSLQGLIWKLGYQSGEVKGHVYDDVAGTLKKWTDQGVQVGIYSSGSVLAQKLLFSHSLAGDLTPYLSFHFDTAVGGKRESQSYLNIKEKLGSDKDPILFLSDVPEELAAAREAGFEVGQVVRSGTTPHPDFPHRSLLEG